MKQNMLLCDKIINSRYSIMDIFLSDKQMDQIASKTANIILRKMKEDNEPTPEMVSVKEAARILRISEAHMRRIKDQYPHMKIGDKNQGRLLFKRDSLLKG